MPVLTVIDPVTRLEGHLRVEISVDTVSGQQQVVEARVAGTSFRGFEQMLVGRNPVEAPQLTQRICGVCSAPHGMAAVLALDQAAGVPAPANARLLRNLVTAANFIHSHIFHFYHLSMLDFIGGPAMPPWQPEWSVDRRIDGADATRLIEHYQASFSVVRQTQEMGAVFAGRLPHAPAFVPGGFTNPPDKEQITQFGRHLSTVAEFIRSTYLPDVDLITSKYPEYSKLGRGCGNLICFGAFETDGSGKRRFFNSGHVTEAEAKAKALDLGAVSERVACSWYEPAAGSLMPLKGLRRPLYPKERAYSWIKAPRYDGEPCEAGPLARMWISGRFQQGVSVNDRHLARARETLALAEAVADWLGEIKVGETVYDGFTIPAEAGGVGLTEAPRGALGHWVRIADGKIAHYQVITPTCWNASPRDDAGKPGPIESALLETPVQDLACPVEALRVIRSFDPCLACAVHVSRPGRPPIMFRHSS